MIYVQGLYENRLNTIWDNCSASDIKNRGYCIESSLPKNGILFLGMNPSFKNGTEENGNRFYPLLMTDKSNVGNHLNYWNKLLETAEKLGESQLCHHDLFFVRERNQAAVLNLIDDAAWKKFFNEQLQMSEEIVKAAEPRIIVVVNAGVSNLIKAKHVFGFNPTPYWWEKLGVDMLQINGKDTPILFTGMLTGQRAIDNGTYNSLMWHINYVLQNENQYR